MIGAGLLQPAAQNVDLRAGAGSEGCSVLGAGAADHSAVNIDDTAVVSVDRGAAAGDRQTLAQGNLSALGGDDVVLIGGDRTVNDGQLAAGGLDTFSRVDSQGLTAQVDGDGLVGADVPGGILQQLDGIAVLRCRNSLGQSPVRSRTDLSLGVGPLGLQRNVPGGHSSGDHIVKPVLGPASEQRIRPGGSGNPGRVNFRAIVRGDLAELGLAIHKGDGVLVDLPSCLDGQVLSGHGRGDLGIPTLEGVAFLGGIRRSRDSRAIILGNGSDLGAAIRIEGDGVLVDRPLSRDGHVRGRHGRGDRLIPAGEGVAFLGGIRRSRNSRAVILSELCKLGLAVHKGDGVLVDLPLGGDGQVLSRHGRGDLSIPALEGVASGAVTAVP